MRRSKTSLLTAVRFFYRRIRIRHQISVFPKGDDRSKGFLGIRFNLF